MSHGTTPDHAGGAITILKVQPFGRDTQIALSIADAAPTEAIDERHSAYHENRSPPLIWSAVEGAAAYAILVEDPDAPRDLPFVHWMIWNIPGEATSLPEGLPAEPRLGLIGGAAQGRNDAGGYGYFGPRPPVGHGVHHYHFQIFALAAPLDMGPDTPLADLVNALKGYTLADGELVLTYEAPSAQ